MSNDIELKQQLVNLLIAQKGTMIFEDMVRYFPPEYYNSKPNNVPYSFWHLLEHLRICQADMIDFMQNPNYAGHLISNGYWPNFNTKTDHAGWQSTIGAYLNDRQELVKFVQNPSTDLFKHLSNTYKGRNILHATMMTAEHNSYHIGEFAILRGVMKLW
ncbi:MAG: DinB family protein [Chloroflexota bacterium]